NHRGVAASPLLAAESRWPRGPPQRAATTNRSIATFSDLLWTAGQHQQALPKPLPQPPPRSGEGEPNSLSSPPLRFGEGVGGRGFVSACQGAASLCPNSDRFQSNALPSVPPVARALLSGANATANTLPRCPINRARSLPVASSHKRAVPSS